MKILRGIGKVVKPLVNFPRWMDWRSVSTTATDIGKSAKGLFVPAQATRQETFEAATRRLHLTEKDIQERMKNLLRMAVIYCVIAVGLTVYTCYLLAKGHALAGLLGTVLSLLALSFAFREHFWYFQMQQRRLGCTVKQWLAALFRGRVQK
jgi:intracellular multiplication protein IcmV